MKKKILIVDDDYGITETLKGIVESIDCEADVAYDGEEALSKIDEKNLPDLIILDWMMPILDGWEVCKRIKENKKTCNIPVIMLTAKNSPEDEVSGIDIGADDYITKPFDFSVVEARIKAALRKTKKEDEIKIGEICINLDKHEVLVRGKSVKLTPKEFELLYFLMSNSGKAMNRDTISEKIWGYEHLETTRAIDETIKCLRDKLGSQARKIETVTGIGYKFIA